MMFQEESHASGILGSLQINKWYLLLCKVEVTQPGGPEELDPGGIQDHK